MWWAMRHRSRLGRLVLVIGEALTNRPAKCCTLHIDRVCHLLCTTMTSQITRSGCSWKFFLLTSHLASGSIVASASLVRLKCHNRLTYEWRSRIDDEGARRGTSSTKNVSTCRAAIMLLPLTATRPVDPQLTATSIAWHTWQLSGPLYTSPITAPVLNTPYKSIHLHRFWQLIRSALQQWQTSQRSSNISKDCTHKDKKEKDQLPSHERHAKRQVLDPKGQGHETHLQGQRQGLRPQGHGWSLNLWPTWLLWTLRSCCQCFRSSTSHIRLDGPTTSSQSPNHDWPAELCCRGTVSEEQSSGWSTEAGNDTEHFQVTTQGPSVLHLMCRRTEGTSTTVRCCCGVFHDFCAGYKTANLLTYLLTYKNS